MRSTMDAGKIRTIVVVAVATAIAWGTMAMISLLCNLPGFRGPHLTAEVFQTGQVYRLWLARETWAHLFSLPRSVVVFVDLYAMGAMFVISTGIVLAGRRRYRRSYTMLGVLCLLSASFPYAMGAAVLYDGKVAQTYCGPWLAAMILSFFYGSVACIVLASVDLIGPERIGAYLRQKQSRAQHRIAAYFRPRQYRAQHGLCLGCGYDLRASGKTCPECGEAVRNAEVGSGNDEVKRDRGRNGHPGDAGLGTSRLA